MVNSLAQTECNPNGLAWQNKQQHNVMVNSLAQSVTQTDWPGKINNNNTTLWQIALLKQSVTQTDWPGKINNNTLRQIALRRV